jgi:TonB family protein
MPATTKASGPPSPVDPRSCAAVEVQAAYRHRMIQASCLRRPRARYLIGAGPGADAPAPVAEGEAANHVLIESSAGGFTIQVLAGMTGEVSREGQAVSLDRWVEEHGRSFACHTGDQIQLRHGEMRFSISGAGSAPAPRQLAPRLIAGWRWREQKYTAGTAMVLALVVQAAFMLPPDPRALVLARLGSDVRLLPFRLIPPEPPPTSGAGPALPGTGRQAGAAGAPAAPAPGKRLRSRDRDPRRPPAVPSSSRSASESRIEIRSAGVLGIFSAAPDSPLNLLLGPESSLGADPDQVLRGLVRGPGAGSPGAGGLGVAGTGAGPDLGTIGGCGALGGGVDCTGGPHRRDYGRFAGSLPGRRTIAPQLVPGAPTVRGSLDRDVVRRVVRLHLNEIRFCYQKELAARPELSGRVVLNFTIAGDGRVAAALVQSSSLGNPRVELCLVQAIRRWAFPQPAGGGLVIATYPFNFVAAGSGW